MAISDSVARIPSHMRASVASRAQAALPLTPGTHALEIPCWRPNDARARNADELNAHYTGLRPELVNEAYVHARSRLTVDGDVLPHRAEAARTRKAAELAAVAAVPPWERGAGPMYQDYIQTVGMGTVHVQARGTANGAARAAARSSRTAEAEQGCFLPFSSSPRIAGEPDLRRPEPLQNRDSPRAARAAGESRD